MARFGWASLMLLGTLAVLGLLGPSNVGPVTAPALAETPVSLDGQEVFMGQKCNLCHSIEAADIEAKTKSDKLKGPDLSEVTERHEDDWIAKYLRKEETMNDEEHKKAFTGSDEELGALISWLHSLTEAEAE